MNLPIFNCNTEFFFTLRAKNIQNKARINEDPKDAMLREFQREIEELKRQLEEGSGGEEGGEEEEGGGGSGRRRRKEKKRAGECEREISPPATRCWLTAGSAGISPRAAAKVREQLERERAELLKKTGLAKEERDLTRQELERKEGELVKAQ